jgi:hypothetical protein
VSVQPEQHVIDQKPIGLAALKCGKQECPELAGDRIARQLAMRRTQQTIGAALAAATSSIAAREMWNNSLSIG